MYLLCAVCIMVAVYSLLALHAIVFVQQLAMCIIIPLCWFAQAVPCALLCDGPTPPPVMSAPNGSDRGLLSMYVRTLYNGFAVFCNCVSSYPGLEGLHYVCGVWCTTF